jgi:hypothetical protein
VLHAERLEDPVLDEAAVRVVAHLLEDRTEQDVVRVAVRLLRSRLELQAVALEHGDQPFELQVLAHVRRPQLVHVLRDAGRVREQVLDRDLLPLRRVVGQELGDVVAQRQLALLLQHHDRHGGELLGERGDAEHHLGPDRQVELQVGHAVAFPEEHLSVLHHDDRGAGGGRLVNIGRDLVHAACHVAGAG